jgi:hypothetical protein
VSDHSTIIPIASKETKTLKVKYTFNGKASTNYPLDIYKI